MNAFSPLRFHCCSQAATPRGRGPMALRPQVPLGLPKGHYSIMPLCKRQSSFVQTNKNAVVDSILSGSVNKASFSLDVKRQILHDSSTQLANLDRRAHTKLVCIFKRNTSRSVISTSSCGNRFLLTGFHEGRICLFARLGKQLFYLRT